MTARRTPHEAPSRQAAGLRRGGALVLWQIAMAPIALAVGGTIMIGRAVWGEKLMRLWNAPNHDHE